MLLQQAGAYDDPVEERGPGDQPPETDLGDALAVPELGQMELVSGDEPVASLAASRCLPLQQDARMGEPVTPMSASGAVVTTPARASAASNSSTPSLLFVQPIMKKCLKVKFKPDLIAETSVSSVLAKGRMCWSGCAYSAWKQMNARQQ